MRLLLGLLLVPLLAWSNPITVSIQSQTKDLARLQRYKKAAALMTDVVNSSEFRQSVLAHQFNGRPGFASTGNSPQEVLGKLIGGSEVLSPGVDHIWSWDVVLYYKNNTTVGYTYPHVTTLWVNTKFMDQYDLADIARNQAHEMTHKLGFSHDFKKTARRPYSVPYAIGAIVERVARAKLPPNPAPQPTPKPRLAWWRRIF